VCEAADADESPVGQVEEFAARGPSMSADRSQADSASVILSAAKDLKDGRAADEILRCAQDDDESAKDRVMAVGYCSPFVPAEWIAAHGLRPHWLRLYPTEKLTRGVCPYAGALMDAALRGEEDAEHRDPCVPTRSVGTREGGWPNVAGLVLTTTCDQMRYVAAMLEQRGSRPVFLLNVPSTWQTTAAQQLYRDELRRLGRFLVGLGGKTPSDTELADVMLAFDRARESENSRGPTARGDSCRWGGSSTAAPTARGIPLAILGGPLMETDRDFFALVERAGGRIVLDATEGAERTSPRPFDAERVATNPLEELADAYFDGIPDAFRRPNTALYEWLGRELAARQVRGIILRRYLWCDLWHAELQRLREWSPAPVLEIDVGPDDIGAPNRVQGRIEAFLEMLR
jgi:benzoyl-CoA reductase/2-hydroxyglutaryl-CoA dehydratase subunit BcrC/BadD/HgdB